VLKLQKATSEMIEHRRTAGLLPLALTTDVRPFLERLRVEGSALGGAEIFLVVEQLKCGLEIRDTLGRSPQSGLRAQGATIPDVRNLVRFLDGKLLPNGQLEDRCSADLLRIRRQITTVSGRLEAELQSIVSRHEIARVLQDDFIALRNNRHVLPVRIDAQGLVEGIVHALSSSGATVYMEPLATVPLNNELVRLKEQEEVESQRLLLEFSDLLRTRLSELQRLVEDLGRLDREQAAAVLSEEMEGIDPDFAPGDSDLPILEISGARHPLLARALAGSKHSLVPLDLSLEPAHTVLVVSGPNTGGKTVALKTLGLLCLMAQSGLKVPARSARLPLFKRIVIDIGDHQSISDSLSTFSARMANITSMTRDLESPSLVLLDEIGSGTDPEEGAALGSAIIEFFRRKGAVVLATTHHQGIKAYAAQTSGVTNGSMEYDESTLRPLYRLRAGVPGRSGGLDMAERLGLPGEIVRQARRNLPRERELMDTYLRSLQSLQEDLASRLHQAEKEQNEAGKREAARAAHEDERARTRESRFLASLAEISVQMRREWEKLLAEIADRESERRLRREMDRRERRLLEVARASLPTDLTPSRSREVDATAAQLGVGDRARLVSLGLEGTVERQEGDRITLRVGAKTIQARRADLERLAAPEALSLPPGVQLTRAEPVALQHELNLTGKRVEEALTLLDKYLDDASLGGVSPLRIIHGMGTGRLREAIRRFLDSHPQVEGYAEAGEREGGSGATVVRIRL
jgi:DNA mismatch repair protein MutS2